MTELLRLDYESKIREKWGESIFRDIIDTEDLAYSSKKVIADVHKGLVKQRDFCAEKDPQDYLYI